MWPAIFSVCALFLPVAFAAGPIWHLTRIANSTGLPTATATSITSVSNIASSRQAQETTPATSCDSSGCGTGQVCDWTGLCITDCHISGCKGNYICGADGFCTEIRAHMFCQSGAHFDVVKNKCVDNPPNSPRALHGKALV